MFKFKIYVIETVMTQGKPIRKVSVAKSKLGTEYRFKDLNSAIKECHRLNSSVVNRGIYETRYRIFNTVEGKYMN